MQQETSWPKLQFLEDVVPLKPKGNAQVYKESQKGPNSNRLRPIYPDPTRQ